MSEFKVKIQISFIKTFNLQDFQNFFGKNEPIPEDEPIPNIEEIDEFMISKTRYGCIRYKEYIKTIFNYTTSIQIEDDDIHYLKNGVIEFTIPESEDDENEDISFSTIKDVKNYLLSDSLEDGLFECHSISSFPFRATLLKGNPVEMGLLDFRKNDIIVQKN